MPNLDSIEALHLTRDNQTEFTLNSGVTTRIITRVGQGFSEVTGIFRVISTVPAASVITLNVLQSIDGANYDQVDTWPIAEGAMVSFAVKIVARYVRVELVTPAGVTATVRFGGLLKIGSGTP
jgi:hypothetical protein